MTGVAARGRSITSRIRHWYGANPLHLLALLAAFALAGYAVRAVIAAGQFRGFAIWFAVAIIGHDLLLFPLYSLADLSVQRLLPGRGRGNQAQQAPPGQVPGPPLINYVRIPVAFSLLILMVFFPLILGLSEPGYHRASGLTTQPYLWRWLGVTGVLFAGSAVSYALRWRRASSRARKQAARNREQQASRDREQQASRDREQQASRDREQQASRDREQQASRDREQRRPPAQDAVPAPATPSNKMMATARLTSGANAAPNILPGLTTVVRAPAANPTGSSTMIAGMRRLAARIWQATASPMIRARPAKICEALISPAAALAHQPPGIPQRKRTSVSGHGADLHPPRPRPRTDRHRVAEGQSARPR